jgi:hypothetical protein
MIVCYDGVGLRTPIRSPFYQLQAEECKVSVLTRASRYCSPPVHTKMQAPDPIY